MRRERGFGYCGLACCLCSDRDCPGYRREGCPQKEWCRSFRCGREKQHEGCWTCPEYPCKGGILDKLKVQTFGRFLRDYGEDKLLDCLERNERAGLVYHYPGGFTGDYDAAESESELMELLLNGVKAGADVQ